MATTKEIVDLLKDQVLRELDRQQGWLENVTDKVNEEATERKVEAEKIRGEILKKFDEVSGVVQKRVDAVERRIAVMQARAALLGGLAGGALVVIKFLIELWKG